ncbi:hypothetical protein CYLTODRAFT_422947 [Cylindrobasidium torrendii FP15055 ss-10]|uniref:Uncharacterized protein n=1 Tax=Cylindrobasidium torrendii FP15055 ss-10 TaxID=1314674 RepID=A0A0D7B9T7_9AGAR|nr:hypothetical protein CYLTODRAFT_422947 [Cylindrobasidium torrendii FP15055 ss-10]
MTVTAPGHCSINLLRFTVSSSDVIEEDARVNVCEEKSERVIWFKERYLRDEEIVEHLIHNATRTVVWTIHRPTRGWYLRIRAPAFPSGAFVDLVPPRALPLHIPGDVPRPTSLRGGRRPGGSMGRAGREAWNDVEREARRAAGAGAEGSLEMRVRTRMPAPSRPPSMGSTASGSTELGSDDSHGEQLGAVCSFILAPHISEESAAPPAHRRQSSGWGLGVVWNTISRLLPKADNSFALRRVGAAQNKFGQAHDDTEGVQLEDGSGDTSLTDGLSRRLGPVHLPPSTSTLNLPSTATLNLSAGSYPSSLVGGPPPALLTFTDTTPVFSLQHGRFGLIEISKDEERVVGVETSFWVAVALAYADFLTERESYIAAASD